jgi:hypothetical protein
MGHRQVSFSDISAERTNKGATIMTNSTATLIKLGGALALLSIGNGCVARTVVRGLNADLLAFLEA